MKITEEAKNVLNQVLAENNADGLLVTLQETCCGKNPVFQMAVLTRTILWMKLMESGYVLEKMKNL